MLIRSAAFFLALAFSFSCQTSKTIADLPKKAVSYEEFQKILSPRSLVYPIRGEDASLTLLAREDDKYAKLYTLDHKTREFNLTFDAGEGIDGLYSNDKGDRWFITMDNGGDENSVIYEYDYSKKAKKKVFGHRGFKAIFSDLNKKETSLYVLSNHEDKALYQLYRVNLDTLKIERLTNDKISYNGAYVNPSESSAVLLEMLGNNLSRVYSLDLKTRKTKVLLSKPKTVFYPSFMNDKNNTLYFITDDDRDRLACAKIQLTASKNAYKMVISDPKADILDCVYEKAGDFSYTYKQYRGRTKLSLYEGMFAKEISTSIDSKTSVSDLIYTKDTNKLIVKESAANNPGEYYEYRLNKDGIKNPRAISNLNRSRYESDELATSFDVDFASFDGLKIHGILFGKKSWMSDGRKRPLIVWPHGGPDYAATHRYSSDYQYQVAKGFWVFEPNFRGSTGYGKKFETLNDRDWGGGHIKDVIWGTRHLRNKNYVDSDRVFIAGGSFGGYSVLSAITQFPKEYKKAVAIVAIANLETFMKSIPPDPAWQSEFTSEIGDPIKDKQLYYERSPYNFAYKIEIPLRIYQAENDVRTVKAEMDEFVKKMKKEGKPVSYTVLEDVGHAIAKPELRKKIFKETVEFFKEPKK